MPDEWPPDGFTSPRKYESSDGWTLAIGFVLILPVFVLVRAEIKAGTAIFAEWVEQVGVTTGIAGSSHQFLLLVILAIGCWIITAGAIIIVLHESTHYAIAALLDVNPRFEFHTQFNLPNPSVVAYAKGITRCENILMLSGPFVILSLVCATTAWATTGFVAATAAIMFAINAVPSCGDLYHVGHISLLPRGTLFANFDDDTGLRTEIASPR